MKRFLILSILLSVVIIISCEKGVENPDVLSMNINCDNLRNGIINMDSEIVKTEINKLSADLNSEVTADDNRGQQENLNILIDRINRQCDNINAELICYACIETNPPQSEILVKTDSSGVEIKRVVDIFTPGNAWLSCVRVHQY